MTVRFRTITFNIGHFYEKGLVHSRPILTEYRPFSIEPSCNLETILSQSQPSSRSYLLRIQNGNNYDVNGGQLGDNLTIKNALKPNRKNNPTVFISDFMIQFI